MEVSIGMHNHRDSGSLQAALEIGFSVPFNGLPGELHAYNWRYTLHMLLLDIVEMDRSA
jgi:hypothetical protein